MSRRIDVISLIMKRVTNEIVISSNGMISRELFAVKDRPRNLYLLGGMSSAIAVGLGMALNSKHEIVVISGDGAALMSLGTLALQNHLKLLNLKVYILDNVCHGSTGGQPTCSKYAQFNKIGFNVETYEISKYNSNVPRIFLSPKQIKERFLEAITN